MTGTMDLAREQYSHQWFVQESCFHCCPIMLETDLIQTDPERHLASALEYPDTFVVMHFVRLQGKCYNVVLVDN